MRIGDGLFGILLLVVAAGVLWHVRGFPTLPGYFYGPGFFPSAILLGLLACGALLTLRGVRARSRGEPAAEESVDQPLDETVARSGGSGFGIALPDWRGSPRGTVSVAILLATVFAFYFWGEVVGFQILGFVSLAVFYLWLGRGIVWSLGLAVVITLVFDVLFRVILRVPLPSGYFPLLW